MWYSFASAEPENVSHIHLWLSTRALIGLSIGHVWRFVLYICVICKLVRTMSVVCVCVYTMCQLFCDPWAAGGQRTPLTQLELGSVLQIKQVRKSGISFSWRTSDHKASSNYRLMSQQIRSMSKWTPSTLSQKQPLDMGMLIKFWYQITGNNNA